MDDTASERFHKLNIISLKFYRCCSISSYFIVKIPGPVFSVTVCTCMPNKKGNDTIFRYVLPCVNFISPPPVHLSMYCLCSINASYDKSWRHLLTHNDSSSPFMPHRAQTTNSHDQIAIYEWSDVIADSHGKVTHDECVVCVYVCICVRMSQWSRVTRHASSSMESGSLTLISIS